jgi:hypothetical protein
MTPKATSDHAQFIDPWPSRQPGCPATPWIMSGSVVTAWFDLPYGELLEQLSPTLMPNAERVGPSRVRFYDIEYRSADPNSPNGLSGSFREAVVAFPAAYGECVSELSAFMWTDSDVYMQWGREVFGWPILRGSIDLHGSIWAGHPDPPLSGEAIARLPQGEVSIEVGSVVRQLPPPPPSSWLTPRSVPSPADGCDRRELLLVRPRLIDPGNRFEVTGSAALAFPSDHPLAKVKVQDPRIEVSIGISICVGDQVERL